MIRKLVLFTKGIETLWYFSEQIGKTFEAYIDDVVIKTIHIESLIDDLRLTFDNL